jgi:hypothetical protein
VPRFLDHAGAARADERDAVVRTLTRAGANEAVLRGFIREVERVRDSDYTRALLALALLGETRSPVAVSFLEEFANRPLPERGTQVDGEILEQVRQAQLQAKAVAGLAYANDARSNAAVMQIISRHPSRIVRAEAINAYLWNHGDSEEAKRTLAPIVRPEEAVFIDRVRRVSGESAETFNPRLEAFLDKHPEAVAPKPELSTARTPRITVRPTFDEPPPAF